LGNKRRPPPTKPAPGFQILILYFMLRISEAGALNERVVLKLEGRIAGPWVAEVLDACEHFLREHRALQLDLAGVSFLDRTGTAAISRLKSRGVALENCSSFVVEQLKDF